MKLVIIVNCWKKLEVEGVGRRRWGYGVWVGSSFVIGSVMVIMKMKCGV
ncbi:unnamed protein product [Lathyrus oleraceus]